jgi:S-adenosylmethionine:tRNA ribosyltransferase-isomerase
MYTTDDFDFDLPDELIAQTPLEQRDQSRLMVLDRENETIAHRSFFELPELLREGDVLVLNDSKVFPARLHGHKPTDGRVELLLLNPLPGGDGGAVWEAMTRGSVREGTAIELSADVKCRVLKRAGSHTWKVQFSVEQDALQQFLDDQGETPIPPYITQTGLSEQELRERYQNVYARERGSAAAPTAGLHFTPEVFAGLQERGVQIEHVTLHVGLGTFAPVKSDDIAGHDMHSELAAVSEETAQSLNAARRSDRRVIAVGTTSVRTLESFTTEGVTRAGQAWTDIFMTPGYQFQAIDGMITNFHTPRSTLLMLISAFAGYDFTMSAYREAIDKQYRFYSFGDSMVIT